MLSNLDFGIDLLEYYGMFMYVDDVGVWYEEKVIFEVGDYGCVYDGLYDVIINGKLK